MLTGLPYCPFNADFCRPDSGLIESSSNRFRQLESPCMMFDRYPYKSGDLVECSLDRIKQLQRLIARHNILANRFLRYVFSCLTRLIKEPS